MIANHTKSLVTPRIFNTVLSRSRFLVVAVGNPFTLLESEKLVAEQRNCWEEFIKACLFKAEGYSMTFAATNMSNRSEIVKSLALRVRITLPSDVDSDDFLDDFESLEGGMELVVYFNFSLKRI